jgi:hypothetical protein
MLELLVGCLDRGLDRNSAIDKALVAMLMVGTVWNVKRYSSWYSTPWPAWQEGAEAWQRAPPDFPDEPYAFLNLTVQGALLPQATKCFCFPEFGSTSYINDRLRPCDGSRLARTVYT